MIVRDDNLANGLNLMCACVRACACVGSCERQCARQRDKYTNKVKTKEQNKRRLSNDLSHSYFLRKGRAGPDGLGSWGRGVEREEVLHSESNYRTIDA